jgi:NADPH-dependent 2,4-dienoyl-CoA reductase/sulfur reductase-like enzyme
VITDALRLAAADGDSDELFADAGGSSSASPRAGRKLAVPALVSSVHVVGGKAAVEPVLACELMVQIVQQRKAMDMSPYRSSTATLPQFAKLSEDLSADVAVVGGGITGLTTAYLLAKAGQSVALLERGRWRPGDTSTPARI